ncbi:homeodomain-interacting protein kinase 2-like [Syngnathus typhle]|uniref:homeodomain-interacting protein kinase 2-like n=1 Tax=Syngnathus typhle TaxID=161592 RepID=UPI002A6AF2D4|nr:homeodomain-interacting protein kinase 2-like [Syngnathus typhle]
MTSPVSKLEVPERWTGLSVGGTADAEKQTELRKMSSWTSSESSASSVSSMKVTKPEVKIGKVLYSKSNAYSVLDFIGEGCYGKVAVCENLETSEVVAIKILKNDPTIKQDTEKEVSMLKIISVKDADSTNVVKFFEQFEHEGNICLVFEVLDCDLIYLLKERQRQPLSLEEIRVITRQLLMALVSLKHLGILHADIKPDNIMIVNRKEQPLKVKLIDFGNAIPASKIKLGVEIQPVGYRAPEITLGLPYNENIDVWSVGCIMAFLFLPGNLFAVNCEYQMMKHIICVLGQPEDHLLQAGKYTENYFTKDEEAGVSHYRLITPEEFEAANNEKPKQQDSCRELPKPLEDMIALPPEEESTEGEVENREAFLDLLKQMLHLDGQQRISASQALQHPFITMPQQAYSGRLSPLIGIRMSNDELKIPPSEENVDFDSNKSIFKRIRKFLRRISAAFWRMATLLDSL